MLIGDIGGTNARFALADPDTPGYRNELILASADFPSAELAIKSYLAQTGAPPPRAICLAAAGPLVNGQVHFTNSPWSLCEQELRAQFALDAVRLLNDFEAIAWSVPLLADDQLVALGGPPGKPLHGDYLVGVVGPGTGLGVAAIGRRGGVTFALRGEGGHLGFAPENDEQVAVLQVLRTRFARVSDERLVSGQGIENLYWALGKLEGTDARLSVVDVCARAISGEDQRAERALAMFFEVLGQVAGNVALTLGAVDGIRIAGGVAQRYPEALLESRFRAGFENKGRHTAIMQTTPTHLISHPHPGLLGVSYCAQVMLAAQSADQHA